ncbi:hypothetical protein [Streptomyces sp. NPDC092903]|uniref:hypothetical protein n=1 Tax=Streptomyces sp. NPDC092903 TaxID=3366017 RepID=UPI00381029B4
MTQTPNTPAPAPGTPHQEAPPAHPAPPQDAAGQALTFLPADGTSGVCDLNGECS